MSGDDVRPGDFGQLPSSSTANDYYSEEEVIDVEESITTLLASLQLERLRTRRPTESDDEQLHIVHQRLRQIIAIETDDTRKRRLRRALPFSNCVREQIYYLRRVPSGTDPAPSYYPTLSNTLDRIVKESFDEEYRKIAILLGFVEALAEILILELSIFGVPNKNEHRSIRKLIANALTNLTYGHAQSKRKLCFYPDFISTVVRVLNEAQNLAQVYAGLIRNLSWMSDGKMSDVLAPAARALARTAVIASEAGDDGCLRSALSALWNLASHSERNKRAICDEPGCLTMLTNLLTSDARMTVIVESASGILKYVSQYLSTTTSHLNVRPELAAQLVQLLNSASFTIVANTLGALSNLIAKDIHLQSLVRHDGVAMNQLNVLRNSAREDIRSAVKNVLNYLNQPTGYTRFNEMSSSMGCEMISSPRDGRLLALRGMRASPGCYNPFSNAEHRSSSLPRHFYRKGLMTSVHGTIRDGFRMQPTTCNPAEFNQISQASQVPPIYGIDAPVSTNVVIGNPDLSESVLCTRSTSAQSLGSEIPNTSGWESVLDTAANSNRMSPVSPSDLPDSPTQCASILPNASANMTTPLRITVRNQVESHSAPSEQSRLTTSDATTAIVDDQPTPTFPAFVVPNRQTDRNMELESPVGVLPGPCMDEDDYALLDLDGVGADLLEKSIEAEMPSATSGRNRRQNDSRNDNRLLADMIESAQPSPRKTQCSANQSVSRDKSNNTCDAERLLNACIDSAMPQFSINSPFVTGPKNGRGGHESRTATPRVRHSSGRHATFEDSMIKSSLIETAQECVRDASQLPRCESSGSWSDSEEDGDAPSQSDAALPLDCYEDDNITIDCSVISASPRNTGISSSSSSHLAPHSTFSASTLKRPTSASNIQKKTRLPKPTTPTVPRSSNSLSKNSSRTASAKPLKQAVKETKSAVVPPYNYQKPKSPNFGGVTNVTKEEKNSNTNSSQMLVTTV